MEPLDRIMGYAHVAKRYGLEEAIFLDSVIYWYKENKANDRNFYDGRWWTYNSVRAFDDLFPWWTPKQIRRIIDSCKSQRAILTGSYNEDKRDRTVWYSPGNELLELYGLEPPAEAPSDPEDESGKCICPNGQMDVPDRANESAQTGEALPCSNHVSSIPPIVPPQGDGVPSVKKTRRSARKEPKEAPDWKPEIFLEFWNRYPRGENKQAAIRAWDKLQPSDELLGQMAEGLRRQKRSRSWQEGIGIPYFSTWLNGQRWTDEGGSAHSKSAGTRA